MKNILLWFLLFIFIVIDGFFLIKNVEYKVAIKDLNYLIEQLQRKNDFLEMNQSHLTKNCGCSLDLETLIFEQTGNEISLRRLIADKTKLILYIPKFSCTSCYEKVISNMSSIDSLYKGDSVIVLSTYDNVNSLNNFRRVNQIKRAVYNIKNNLLPYYEDNLTKPCFIEVMGDGKIKSIQIIDVKYFDLVEKYLTEI